MKTIPHDKANHFIINQLAALVVYLCLVGLGISTPIQGAILFGILLAIAWEVYQKITSAGEPSALDSLAGILGTLVVFIPAIIK